MLLKDSKRDSLFKKELALCIDPDHLRVGQVLQLILRARNFTSVGAPIKQLAGSDQRPKTSELRRQLQLATGNDRDALFFLDRVVPLLQYPNAVGVVQFTQLQPTAKRDFVFALEHASEIGNPVSPQQLLEAEVASISSGGFQVTRLGQYSDSRLGDLLLKGGESDRAFAVEQLERLHRGGFRTHDSCYPQLLYTRGLVASSDLKRRIAAAIHRIERDNPSATLPVVVRDVTLAIQSGSDPMEQFRKTIRPRNLPERDICLLALGVAEHLDETGQREAKTQVLGIAAQYMGKDRKLIAWIALAFDDTANAAQAFFDYGLTVQWDVERYHAVEAGCRLLFRTNAIAAEKEYLVQAERYRETGVKRLVDRMREWHKGLDSFRSYLEARLEVAKTKSFDHSEIRISQRSVAELNFLLGAIGNFRKCLNTGIAWFEKSALDNDAPWILGERLLLNAVRDSLASFKGEAAYGERADWLTSVERSFARAADLLKSPYPLSLSLAFRAISRSSGKILPASIRDLSIAIEMLDPKTPEVLEIQTRIVSARWTLLQGLARQSQIGVRRSSGLWKRIAALVPLLGQVVDEDQRLAQHFSPVRFLALHQKPYDLAEMISLSDRAERGRLLEDLIVSLVDSSEGLRVVDVRHRNDYEEIDIIVALTKYNPLLSHWGPMLLIECKNWRDKVGTEPVRSFYTKMTTKKGAVRLGVIVSPSGFTKGVREVSRVLSDGLIVAVGSEELQEMMGGKSSFLAVIERLIPGALFA